MQAIEIEITTSSSAVDLTVFYMLPPIPEPPKQAV
jgi:hypothetical protein